MLHDLGHGPFSHLFEEVVPDARPHEEWTVAILLDSSCGVHRTLSRIDPQMPERVAAFLSRCLFSMFAEDVGLLPKIDGDGAFTALLKSFLLPPPAEQAKIKKDIAATEKAKAKAEGDLKKFEGQTTSMMGLEKPYFLLKNPGLISIPLGFLVVILGSLLFRDKRSEEMWDELYVRQNTGIHAEGASAH